MSGCGESWCERQDRFEVDVDGSVVHVHRSVEWPCGPARVYLESSFVADSDGLTVEGPHIVIAGVGEDQPLSLDDAWWLQGELATFVELVQAKGDGRRPVL